MSGKGILDYEERQWQKGIKRLAGVDEAGRGPLAGPVVAAAVVMPQKLARAELNDMFAGLTDSKQISEKKREHFFSLLNKADDIEIGVGICSPAEIDKLNILRATHLAMKKAVEALPRLPEHILVDGRPVKGLPVASTSIVKGDSLSLLIAAASIIAKVTRDHIMCDLDKKYPEYGFAAHKGYGTAAHLAALKKHGATPVHRQSFRPVRESSGETFTQMNLLD